MSTTWTAAAPVRSARLAAPMSGQDMVTLVEGNSFCVCGRGGDMTSGSSQGLYVADTRVVSRWELSVDGEPVEPVQALSAAPYHAMFLGRVPSPGLTDSTLLIRRERFVGAGMREDITLVNVASRPAHCTLTINLECDLADLFEVKGHRNRPVSDILIECEPGDLHTSSASRRRGVHICADAAAVGSDHIGFEAVVPAKGKWRASIEVAPTMDGVVVRPLFLSSTPPDQAGPVRQLRAWYQVLPRVQTGQQTLAATLLRCRDDLGALRLFDPDRPGAPPSVAAGAPWFMTLFGRDSLIASWMALPLDSSLAVGTLQWLARLQGKAVDRDTEEEPGRIMHEIRFGMLRTPVDRSGVYYGSVDATPLFVMLLGELQRWGLHSDAVRAFLPAADDALRWIDRYGDLDGDGFVEYQRKTEKGIANQGWKDSFDGVNFADGTMARAPVALAEVQGYVYAAYLARSELARAAGENALADRWAARAVRLKSAFNERFWLADRGYVAVGLDADKRPIDALASNMGHCLWTGILDDDKAAAVAARLMSPEMFSGFGVRTLASSMAAYNPMSYHNGSVWPHDNALCAAGLMRYGFVDAAQRIARGLLAATQGFGGRLPELFCGFDRAEYPVPVAYPTACTPQAWAAATPVHLLRTLLRFDPSVPTGKLHIAPALPEEFGALHIRGLRVAQARITLDVDADRVTASNLPPGLELVDTPAHG
jgi:glycogen debranching enzyme